MREGGPPPRVVAIGIGGGADLRVASDFGAQSVLGIEINQQMVQLTRDDYAEFNGGICQLPGVHLMMGEGRSTLRRLDETFDVIQISGADTYTSPNSGTFVLSESYLYTTGAIRDFLDHLTAQGDLGIMRFSDDPPWECCGCSPRASRCCAAWRARASRRRGDQDPILGRACSRSSPSMRTTSPSTGTRTMPPARTATCTSSRGRRPRGRTGPALAGAIDSGTEASFYRTSRWTSGRCPTMRPSSATSTIVGSWEEQPSSFSREFDLQFPVAPRC
jgi:hypothetical protein